MSCSEVLSAGLHHVSHPSQKDCGRRKGNWFLLSDGSWRAPLSTSLISFLLHFWENLVLSDCAGLAEHPSQPAISEGRASTRSTGHCFCRFPWFQAWVSLSLWLVCWCLLIYFASCCCTRALCRAAVAWQVTSFLLSPYLKVLRVLNWNHSNEAEILKTEEKKQLFWML